MRLRTSLSIPILILGVVLVAGCASSPPLDFGDQSPGNLWYQAEARRGAGDLDQALIYADKLIELHSADAREMQASLSDYPPTKDAYGYQALNAVGAAFLIKGEILTEKGDKAGAREAFNTLIRDFGYAQFQGAGNPEDWIKAAEIAGRYSRKLSPLVRNILFNATRGVQVGSVVSQATFGTGAPGHNAAREILRG